MRRVSDKREMPQKTLSESEQEKRGKKPKVRLLFIVSSLMIGVSALIIIFLVFIIQVVEYGVVAGILGETIAAVAERHADELDDYQSLPWLLSYWEEHREDLDLDPKQLKDKNSEIYKARQNYLFVSPQAITVEQAQEMKEDMQRIFAEYCYITIAESFSTSAHTNINLISSCFRPGDENGYVYFYDESFGDDGKISLGTTFQISPDFLKSLSQMQEEGSDKEDEDSWLNLGVGNSLFYNYYPVWADGRIVCVAASGFEKDDVQNLMESCALMLLIPVIVLLCILQLVLLLLLNRMIVKPARAMQQTVRKYSETKNSADMRDGLRGLLKKKDEYGRLSVDITEMADNIDIYVGEIKEAASEKQKLFTELETAETIQKSQLPSVFPAFPERSDFDLYASMNPAKEVGGDFYDFFLIDEDHIALVIGDVSDKGIPAALVMMACRTLIRSTLLQGIAPGEAMTHVNRQICETNAAEMFVTVWVAVIELSTGKGIEINAGHEKPVLRRAGESFELIKNPHDMAVGTWEEQTFTEQPFELHPGDTLFVYTDGVPEATSGAKELFGAERMLDALNEKPDLSPEEQIRHMEQSVNSFVSDAEQFDDMTMLCFSFSPSSLDDR